MDYKSPKQHDLTTVSDVMIINMVRYSITV